MMPGPPPVQMKSMSRGSLPALYCATMRPKARAFS
jgi:hypothetical protein